jgi:hypothetical protein
MAGADRARRPGPAAGTLTVAGRGDRGGAFLRPAGKCPVVRAPVKGARKRASLRDGARATLDCHASSQEIGAYQEEAAVRPPAPLDVESTTTPAAKAGSGFWASRTSIPFTLIHNTISAGHSNEERDDKP